MKKLLSALIICILALQTNAQVLYYPDHSNTNFEGLRLYDNDSTFGINMRFRIQSRVGMTFDDEMNLHSSELLVRRLRLRFKGYMLTKKLQYAIQLGFSRSDQDWDNSGVPNIIRDAVVTYKPNSHFSIGIGQTKLPGNRERLISSGELQFVDRSNANARLTLDRDAGVFTSYENKLFGTTYILSGAFTSGKGRNPSTNNNGFGYTGKIEWLPLGTFTMGGNYFSGDWVREAKPKLSFSGVYSLSDNATRTGVQLGEALYETRDVTTIIADMLFKYRGWSVMAEYFNRHTDNPVTTSGTLKPRYVYNGEGMNFHLSYQFKNHFEIAGRYTNVNPQNPVNAFEVNQTDYVLGFNKYLKFHRTKLQTDVTYFTKLNEVTDESTSGWMIRFQVELGI